MVGRGVRLILAVFMTTSIESGGIGGPQGTTLGTRGFGQCWHEMRVRGGGGACDRACLVDTLGLRGGWCVRLRGGQWDGNQQKETEGTQVLGDGVPFLTGLDKHLGAEEEEEGGNQPPSGFPEDDCIEYRGHEVGEACSDPEEYVVEEEGEDANVRDAKLLMQMGRFAPMEVPHPDLDTLPHAPPTLRCNVYFGKLPPITSTHPGAGNRPSSAPKRLATPCGWRLACHAPWKLTSCCEPGSARSAGAG